MHAHRELLVFAMLLYTKVLHIVSGILFSFSQVINLPGKDTTLVSSVDANVTLLRCFLHV